LNIKAIILAGGKATRLLPLTEKTPKSLVPVLNTPFLDHVLLALKSYGIEDVTIACGHLSTSLQEHYAENNLDLNISFTYEESPLGTGGAVVNAWDKQTQTILVLNGDIFSDINIADLLAFHQKSQSQITFSLVTLEDPSHYGVLEIDINGRVLSFTEKPKLEEAKSNLINAGIYIMETSVLQMVTADKFTSFEQDIFPILLANGAPIFGFKSNAYWIDIGKPQDYKQLNFDLLNGKVCTFAPRPRGIYNTEKQNIISDTAIIASTSQIKNSIIWKDVKVGNRAIVDDSVLCKHVQISADCYIKSSLLGQEVYVKEGHQVIEEKIDAGNVFS